MSDFVHLHLHSEYSLLDGACRINDAILQAKKYGMPAMAITDHGNLFGALEFYKTARAAGIKPIIGCEMYYTSGSRFERSGTDDPLKERNYHLILLAKNIQGYKNLIKLSSQSYLEGFHYKPRIDWELLEKYHDNLICLSSCMKGEIPHLLLHDYKNIALEKAGQYNELFGKNNFYLELQDNGIDAQDTLNKSLLSLSKKLDIPLVATNDCHYLKRDNAKNHDVLLCIQTGKSLDDPNRLKFQTDEFYFKSPDEMKRAFAQTPQAILNTIQIAEQCDIQLELNNLLLPQYNPPPDYTLDSYLEELAYQGLKTRYKNITPELENRLKHELNVIKGMGFSGYFLVVWDFIHFARNRNIPVGPGRGSAAGSLVSYCLQITDLDPLYYGLIFERFLNTGRISMPDIDIDFCFERRNEVINYVTQKYGTDNVAQIITFGSLATRNAIRDVGRAMKITLSEVDKIAKLVPSGENITVQKALQNSPELKNFVQDKENIKQLLETAASLEGIPRHASTHSAGIVISPTPLTDYLPLYRNPSTKDIITQFDMNAVSEIGLLKIDLLGLRTLTVIDKTIKLIETRHNIKIDINQIPLDDQKIFNMLSRADTDAIFQLESLGMRDLIRRLAPSNFEDISAVLALYRPGPLGSGMIDDFIKRRHNKIPIEYLHPKLEPFIKKTYGVIVYQEQVMEIASTLAGFTMDQADQLRKAMGKKIPEDMAKMESLFLQGCKKNQIDKNVAKKIFDLMAKFAGYGFNRSHTVAYAMVVYQTAYLKTYFPIEYMASILTSEMGNHNKIVTYIKSCRKMGFAVLPPDINESYANFTVTGDKAIRFGLAAIKNVGLGAIEQIINARQNKSERFQSIYDFCQRVDTGKVNLKVIESLIKCGAFDSFGARRSQMLEILPAALKYAYTHQQDTKHGQTSFFDIAADKQTSSAAQFQFPDIPEITYIQKLQFEKKLLGFYISGHPLTEYEHILIRYGNCSIESISEKNPGQLVKLGGIILNIKTKRTKKNTTMADIILEDLTGTGSLRVFSEVYDKNVALLQKDKLVFITGKIDLFNETISVTVQSVMLLNEVESKCTNSFHIQCSTVGLNEQTLLELKDLLDKYRGNCRLYLHLIQTSNDGEIETQIQTDVENNVTFNPQLIKEIENFIGPDSAWYSNKG